MDWFAAAWVLVCVLGAVNTATELVIPRPCMERVELTEQSLCHGPDKEHISCTGLTLTVKAGCEELRVVR